MSTGLNSMTGVILEDLIKPSMKKPLTEGQASFLMKVMVVIIGGICVGLVFVVEKMGALIQASGSLGAITAGPLLGIFTLGMFFPFANPLVNQKARVQMFKLTIAFLRVHLQVD